MTILIEVSRGVEYPVVVGSGICFIPPGMPKNLVEVIISVKGHGDGHIFCVRKIKESDRLIISLLVIGFVCSEVATILGLSERFIYQRKNIILRRLGVSEAVNTALAVRIIDVMCSCYYKSRSFTVMEGRC